MFFRCSSRVNFAFFEIRTTSAAFFIFFSAALLSVCVVIEYVEHDISRASESSASVIFLMAVFPVN